MPLTLEPEMETAFREALQEAYARGQSSVRRLKSADASGHEHKGKGPGGGQFTASHGGEHEETPELDDSDIDPDAVKPTGGDLDSEAQSYKIYGDSTDAYEPVEMSVRAQHGTYTAEDGEEYDVWRRVTEHPDNPGEVDDAGEWTFDEDAAMAEVDDAVSDGEDHPGAPTEVPSNVKGGEVEPIEGLTYTDADGDTLGVGVEEGTFRHAGEEYAAYRYSTDDGTEGDWQLSAEDATADAEAFVANYDAGESSEDDEPSQDELDDMPDAEPVRKAMNRLRKRWEIVRKSVDSSGHEHKGKGAGGGQFTAGSGGDDGETIGKGSTGEVKRVGNEVHKNATKKEAEVYSALQGVEGVANARVEGGKIITPHFKNIVSVDDVPKERRKSLAPVVAKAYPQLVTAMTALSRAGYDYNDPLQVGFDENRTPHVFDFSMAHQSGEEAATDENLGRLSAYLKEFGAERLGAGVSHVAEVRRAMFDADNVLMADEPETKDAQKLLNQLDGQPASNLYMATNARTIPGVAQTENRNGFKVIVSAEPLTPEFLKQWEITPVLADAVVVKKSLTIGRNEPDFERRLLFLRKSFDEAKHPRGDDGKFISKSEIEAAKKSPAKAEKLRKETTAPAQRAKLDAALEEPESEVKPHEMTKAEHKKAVDNHAVELLKDRKKYKGTKGVDAAIADAQAKHGEHGKHVGDAVAKGERLHPAVAAEYPEHAGESGKTPIHKMTNAEIDAKINGILNPGGEIEKANEAIKRAKNSADWSLHVHEHTDGKWGLYDNPGAGKSKREHLVSVHDTKEEAETADREAYKAKVKPHEDRLREIEQESRDLIAEEEKRQQKPQSKANEAKTVDADHASDIERARAADKKFRGEGRYEAETWQKLRSKNPDAALPPLSRDAAEWIADGHERDGTPIPAEVFANNPDLADQYKKIPATIPEPAVEPDDFSFDAPASAYVDPRLNIAPTPLRQTQDQKEAAAERGNALHNQNAANLRDKHDDTYRGLSAAIGSTHDEDDAIFRANAEKAAERKTLAELKANAPEGHSAERTTALLRGLAGKSDAKRPEHLRKIQHALMHHSHKELKEIREKLGIRASGTKAEIGEKLAARAARTDRSNRQHYSGPTMTVDEAHEALKNFDHSAPGASVKLANILSKQLTGKQLVELKRKLGVKASGSKWEAAHKIARRGVPNPEPIPQVDPKADIIAALESNEQAWKAGEPGNLAPAVASHARAELARIGTEEHRAANPREPMHHEGGTWTKVGDNWHVKVPHNDARPGDTVEVTTKAGKKKTVRLGDVVPHGNGTHSIGAVGSDKPVTVVEKETPKEEVESPKVESEVVAPKPVPEPEITPAPATATPREAAAHEAAQKADEYAFARASAVSNAGEDLKGSARHKRNEWSGLADAEANGTAAEFMTRDKLAKAEPHSLTATINGPNALSHLAAHYGMRSFPSEIGDYPKNYEAYQERASHLIRTSPEDLRKQYHAAYQELKGHAEKLAQEHVDPRTTLREMQSKVADLIHKYRGSKRGEGSMSFAPDKYNPVASALADMHGMLDVRGGKNSAFGRVRTFADELGKKYGGIVAPETLEQAARHASDVMEGESLNKTFGKESKAKTEFNPAELYVKNHAKRTGGRMIDAATVDAGTRHMMQNVGLRGLQYGNSVSDDERQHHLQKSAEALADLADITGLDDSHISLGGKLGLAIGARGRAGALAHYEPDSKIINLTRKSGVGSLAHEWAHALDHDIGGGTRFLTQQYTAPGKNPVADAMEKVQAAMKSSGFGKRLRDELTKDISNGFMSHKKGLYYTSDLEKFARVFEKHVQHKLKAEGRENTYLSGGDDHPYWPTAEETAHIAPHMDALMAAIKEHHFGDK